MKNVLLVLVLGVAVVVGCGPVGGAQGDATATPGTTPAIAGATDTPAAVGTTVVPGMPAGLCMGDCVVTDFSVWQDFMPSVPQAGAPLHAAFSVEINWPEKITVTNTHGSVTILRASGDEVLTGALQLNQQIDDNGLVPPGPQTVSFSMVPAPVTAQLVEGEMLHGTATLTIGDSTITIDLPETALLFTH